MKRIAHIFILTVLVVMVITSCKSEQKRVISEDDVRNHADSLVFEACDERDIQRMLSVVDSLEHLGELSKSRCIFFRTIAYNLRGEFRTSLKFYYQLADIDVNTLDDQGDFESYIYSYNNYLRVLCDMKRYDMALHEAYTADKTLKSIGYDEFTTHHDVAQIIGECQLYLGQTQLAAESFEKSLQDMHRRLEKYKAPIDQRECQHTMRSIAMAYIHRGLYYEALPWIERQVALYNAAKDRSDKETFFVDEMWAEISYCRALLMFGMGDSVYAEKAFESYLSTQTAQSLVNMINSSEFLMLTHRYDEAVRNYSRLDQFFHESGYEADLENIGRYLMPKYRANLLAGRKDSALSVATRIAEAYDSALVRQKASDADLLSTVYDMEGKERQIAEQKAKLSQQRLIYITVFLLLFVAFFVGFAIQRRKAYNKLNTINQQLTLANKRTEELSRMKSEFIKHIFHEVRTPLNALSGFSQVLANPNIEVSNEEMQSISKMIGENSERITKIVDKMLDFDPSREYNENNESPNNVIG